MDAALQSKWLEDIKLSQAAINANARLSFASTSSSLPLYSAHLPEYRDVDEPPTPPREDSVFEVPLTPKSKSPARATGLPTELDLLIAQTSSILLASSECLHSTVETREKLKRFFSLDDMLDRFVVLPSVY
jgi:hypothetical protein